MDYFISFLEGIITFVSPCLLPMLPIYVTYFAAQSEGKRYSPLINSTGFVLGFTVMFAALGAAAGLAGNVLREYKTWVNIVSGIIVILFGINFSGLLNISLLNKTHRISFENTKSGFFPSVLFGFVFSAGWTPCVGAFLGSALMLAASQGQGAKGMLMLLCYSLGLGIPFIASAVLLDYLKSAFDFIKRYYRQINLVSGILLIIMGVLIMAGKLGG